jgi:hypothetical protein
MGVQDLIMQCRAVLLLVHELHLTGHQRLRVVPAMDHSGKYWRCAIAPVSLVSVDHGARLVPGVRDDPRIATYSSRDQNRYFEWTDIYPYANPQELAMHFVERFPEVVDAGRGSDWPYAGWYMEMLRVTHPDQFPYTVARSKKLDTYLPTASPATGRVKLRIPLPPPGEALTYRRSLPIVGELPRPSSRRAPLSATGRRLAG